MIEREAELRTIRAALESAAGGEGRLVVVEGPAGIGKTELVEAAREQAKEMGFGRLKAVGDEPEQSLPWGVVGQLVERSILRYSGETRAAILAGPSGAALRAIEEGAEAGADDVVMARTLHKLWWVAADLSADRPLLITVDDAQWADQPSLRFLAYLSRRLADLSVALVVGTRPVAVADGPLAELAGGRVGDRLTPAPLTVEGVGALSRRASAPVTTALHAASGGNPFLCDQLIAELERQDLSLQDPATARAVAALAPDTIARSVLGRHGLAETRLAGSVAVLGASADLALAGRLAGLEPDAARAAADELRRDQILSPDPDRLVFVHPVLRESVLAGVPAGWRAELHAAAALALRDAGAAEDRVAGHLLHAPSGTLPDAGPRLRAAAARALATGDAGTATAHLRRAASEGEQGADFDAELGRALLRAGEPAEARPALVSAAASAATDAERAGLLGLAAQATFSVAGVRAAADELRAAIRGWTGAEADRLALEARLAVIESFALDAIAGSAEWLERFADLPGETPHERVLLAMLAQRRVYLGGPADVVESIALRALGDGALAADGQGDLQPWALAAHAVLQADRADVVTTEAAHARSRLLPAGSPRDFAFIGTALSVAARRTGELRRCEDEGTAALEALALVDTGLQQASLRAVVTRAVATAQLDQGRPDDAAATLAAHDATLDPVAETSVPVSRVRLARAALLLARDDPGSALALAQQVGDEEDRSGIRNAFVGWRPLAAVAHDRLGRTEDARRLAAEQLEIARAFGAASEIGAALRLAARFDRADRLDLLQEAVAVLAASPARLEHALALADHGEALGVGRQRTAARELLTEAAELAAACGARPLVQRVSDALGGLGDRPKRLMDYGVDELTASERRVAQLAAGGLTNREIAQELFVAPKTVENHLMRAYAKLGVKGRRELAGAMAPS